jgi:hypothetical protein
MDSKQNKGAAADQAIQAYDAFLFSSFGRQFDAGKADALAFDALTACAEAARDRSVNQFTRDTYAGLREQFALISNI